MDPEFTKAGRRYKLLVRPRRPLGGAEVGFSDRSAALSFLRGCAAARVFRDCLARLDPTVGQKVGKLTDQQLLEEIATALINGTMVLVELGPPGAGAQVAQHPLNPVNQLLNLSLPQLGRQAGLIPDVSLDELGLSEKGQQVSRKYLSRLEQMTQVRVRDLFDPKLETVEGFPFLKKIDQDQALGWAKDYMLDLPLGDTGIGRSLGGAFGLDDAQLGLSPKELGQELGDEVKGWVDDLRDDHPALFYGGATLAAVGAGALTYSQGSKYLELVGANKYSQELFGDRVKLDGKFSFGPEFSDLSGSLTAREKLGKGLSLWQKVEGGGESFGDLDLTKFGAGADYDITKGLSMGAGYEKDRVTGSELIKSYLGGKSGSTTYRLESQHGLGGDRGAGGLGGLGGGDHRVSGYVGKQFSNGGFIEGFGRYERLGGEDQAVVGLMAGWSF